MFILFRQTQSPISSLTDVGRRQAMITILGNVCERPTSTQWCYEDFYICHLLVKSLVSIDLPMPREVIFNKILLLYIAKCTSCVWNVIQNYYLIQTAKAQCVTLLKHPECTGWTGCICPLPDIVKKVNWLFSSKYVAIFTVILNHRPNSPISENTREFYYLCTKSA